MRGENRWLALRGQWRNCIKTVKRLGRLGGCSRSSRCVVPTQDQFVRPILSCVVAWLGGVEDMYGPIGMGLM